MQRPFEESLEQQEKGESCSLVIESNPQEIVHLLLQSHAWCCLGLGAAKRRAERGEKRVGAAEGKLPALADPQEAEIEGSKNLSGLLI